MANAQLEYEFLPTARNGRYLVVGGYKYRINKMKVDSDVWKCTSKNCNTTAVTSNDILIRANGIHNHEDVRLDIKVYEVVNKLKESVQSSVKPIPTLYNEEMSQLRNAEWNDDTLFSSMPTFWSVKNSLYSARKAVIPKLPTTRNDLEIPPEWNHYHSTSPRTNNNLEGWHSRIKKVIGKAHPNIFEFIKFLKDEQETNEIRLIQYAGGQQRPPKRSIKKNLEATI